jgi:RNA polymerase sigma factor (sigma-70 family)
MLSKVSAGANTNAADARELIERAAAGDEAAWQELFGQHYVRLYRFFRSRVPTHQQAEDLASDVFLEAFRCIGSFRWQGVPFAGWMFGIARRVLASHYRARPQAELRCEEYVRDEYVAVEIRDILERIQPEYRTALELRFVVGLSGEEAAAVMGRSHGAFRSLLLRAVRAYRAESSSDEIHTREPAPVS